MIIFVLSLMDQKIYQNWDRKKLANWSVTSNYSFFHLFNYLEAVFCLKKLISCFLLCEIYIHWCKKHDFAKSYFPIVNGKNLRKTQPTTPINLIVPITLWHLSRVLGHVAFIFSFHSIIHQLICWFVFRLKQKTNCGFVIHPFDCRKVICQIPLAFMTGMEFLLTLIVPAA